MHPEGAKHKQKEADKEAGQQRASTPAQITKENLASLNNPEVKSAKVEKAEKSEKGKDKKKTPLKDANGNEIKRPLTAYMLFNNYRRPMLRTEHPGKLSALLIHLHRTVPARPIKADWPRVGSVERCPAQGKLTDFYFNQLRN